MGYHGLGLQRWIFTMKPRKFLGKRSKPDGGGGKNHAGQDISNYFHVDKKELENLLQLPYPPRYKSELLNRLIKDRKRERIFTIACFLLASIITSCILIYLLRLFEWF